MNDRSPDMLKPTLLAGVIFGTLGAVPFFNWVNCACCVLVIACGFVAAYLYSEQCRKRGVEFRPGNGALVGLVAGGFYAMVTTVVDSVVKLTVGDVPTRMFLEWLQRFPSLPPESGEMIDTALRDVGTVHVFGLILGFLAWILIGAVFSTIGGLIGGAVFHIDRPPAPPVASFGTPTPFPPVAPPSDPDSFGPPPAPPSV